MNALQRGDVLLQAAVAEAAPGESAMARGRVDLLLELDDDTLFTLTKVAVTFLMRIHRAEGQERTALPDDGTGPNDSARSYTIGLLNAWSAREGSTVKSLFATAAADPHRREEILRDPFDFAIERALELATKHVGPHTLVRQLCKSIAREDRSMAQDWP
ncbi:hypothetical protein G3I60_00370 [Streptomyces sp. SID13666]|uniref:hypothetical protein n=1 Tax=unclassified Streptomyces TaxID=2593676 RepID=UPI0013C0A1F1|nr:MULTISPECIES: hypothetical protein [unclassified Streptomyces]NEA52668.1 hypothetical protein [Streptomyces sp. SID13666]NEA70005.1 hypothetical protein [Streptomyces sp. SID13588]